MTEIEQKALALVNEVIQEVSSNTLARLDPYNPAHEAVRRAIEQHEAFKREVSDAVELAIDRCGHDGLRAGHINEYLGRFILPKPDKQLRSIAADRLVYAASEHFCNRKNNLELIDAIVELAASAALAKRGLEIREIEG